jgi:hypothetical protein
VRLDASASAFPLVSLETLISVFSNLSIYDAVFVLNADFKHWFHQLKMNAMWRGLYTIRCDRETYMPRAWPMGATHAPAVGQHVSWAMLLGCMGNPTTGWPTADMPETGLLRNVHDLKETPAWIPLRNGGGIFVLIDNILIITPDEVVRNYWRQRLASACARYGAIVKHEGCENVTNEVAVIRERLEKYCSTTLTATDGETEFLGFLWRLKSRRLKPDDDTTMPGLDKAGRWVGSHRDLSSALGSINWYIRGYELDLFTDAMKPMRRLYAAATPPANVSWDAQLHGITDEELAFLRTLWQQRCQFEPVLHRPRPALDREPVVDLVATDASMQYGAGVVYANNTSARTLFKYPIANKDDMIALHELQAINVMVRERLAVKRTRPLSLIVLGTDNLNAKAWIERRYAHNDAANEILQQLVPALLQANCRLYLTYVPTAENVADEPSRGIDQLDPKRLEATFVRLYTAWLEAKETFARAGNFTGGQAKAQQ